MIDALYQYSVTAAILFLAGALIIIFGATIACTVYGFVVLHVKVYEWLKEVYNGYVSTNA